MAVNGHKLDTLPSEIIQRIAAVGDCENALALIRVNSTFHRVCNDRQVFRSLIENRNGHWGSKWRNVPFGNTDSKDLWARYALADSKAVRTRTYTMESFLEWAPQLMASNHPILHERNAKLLHTFIRDISWKTHQKANLLLCLALRLMSQNPPEDVAHPCLIPGADGANNAFPQPRQELRMKLLDCLSHDMITTVGDPSLGLENEESTCLHKYSQTLQAVGMLSITIREGLARGAIMPAVRQFGAQMNPLSPYEIVVPTTENMSLHRLMKVPLPFSKGAAAGLAQCHTSIMITKSFLEDGEWVGFYSASGVLQRPLYDPPMRCIHFQVGEATDASMLDLQATGEDGVGRFLLFGQVSQVTGEVTLHKNYDNGGPKWQWLCMMTPFGIVGTWRGGYFGGWVWLWKVQNIP